MKKVFSLVLLALLALPTVFAAGVDEDEIRSVNQTIVFENYNGPHAVVDTLEAIRSIGSGLGTAVTRNLASATNAGDRGRYYIIHAYDPTTKEKFDADILIIGENAAVDHIRNLRHIIAGYLSAAYGYNGQDAATLATFVTVYNAVYRKNLDVFRARYKDVVTRNLTAQNVGLSTRYSEWAGQTEIVIPISDIAGGLSAIETSIISDRQVIASMQEEPNKNIDVRKDMVNIKEREAENANQKAQEAQREATERQKEVDEQNNILQEKQEAAKKAEEAAQSAAEEADKAREKAEEAQKKAEEAQKRADENPDDKEAARAAEQAKKEAEAAQKEADQAKEKANQAKEKAEQAKEEAKKQEENAKKAQDKANEAKKNAAEKQAAADKKQNEAQNERKEIARDQKTVEQEQGGKDAPENVPGVLGLTLTDAALNSAIVKVDTTTGMVVQKSEVTSIKSRTVFEAPDGFIAIAGENRGNGAVKLVKIDKKSLEMVGESEEVISDNSMILYDGGNYLAIMSDKDTGDYVLAKFNSSLEMLLKSPVALNPASPITKTTAGYMVTASDGTPVLLKPADLTKAIE